MISSLGPLQEQFKSVFSEKTIPVYSDHHPYNKPKLWYFLLPSQWRNVQDTEELNKER